MTRNPKLNIPLAVKISEEMLDAMKWVDLGYERAGIDHSVLKKELKYYKRMMWFAWTGWVVTAVMFIYFVG